MLRHPLSLPTFTSIDGVSHRLERGSSAQIRHEVSRQRGSCARFDKSGAALALHVPDEQSVSSGSALMQSKGGALML